MKKKTPEQCCPGHRNLLLTLVFCMVFSATGYAQTILQTRVTISFSDQSLDKALQQLQKTTGINFAYTQNDVQSFQLKPMSFTNEPLEKVCKEIFKNTSLSYKEFSGYIVVTRSAPEPAEKKQAGLLITGTITDTESK